MAAARSAVVSPPGCGGGLRLLRGNCLGCVDISVIVKAPEALVLLSASVASPGSGEDCPTEDALLGVIVDGDAAAKGGVISSPAYWRGGLLHEIDGVGR